MKQSSKEKWGKWLSRKWTSDVTNLFFEILADPVNNFMETSEKRAFKKHPAKKYLIPLLLNLKNARKMLISKKQNQKALKQKRKKPNWWSKSKLFFVT